MDKIKDDISTLHQHFIPTQHMSPLHRSPAHFSSVTHKSQPLRTDVFPAAFEDKGPVWLRF